jgi:hypothetical protein
VLAHNTPNLLSCMLHVSLATQQSSVHLAAPVSSLTTRCHVCDHNLNRIGKGMCAMCDINLSCQMSTQPHL